MGYLGVVVDVQHSGVKEAIEKTRTGATAIIMDEVKRLVSSRKDLGKPDLGVRADDFYRLPASVTTERCHISVAYLGKQNPDRMETIKKAVQSYCNKHSIQQGGVKLTDELDFFGRTIVIKLNDDEKCLHNIHTTLENCLAQLGSAWYVPWHTIGDFVPHISIGSLRESNLSDFAQYYECSGEKFIEQVKKRIGKEVFTVFTTADKHRTIPCKDFSLFSPQREIIATYKLAM